MAVTTIVSNHFKYQLGAKAIDLANDVFKAVLMSGEYAFDKDTDATYSDIIGGELAGGGGYTTGGHDLTISAYTEDDANDIATVTFDDITFTGTDAGFSGEVGSMCVYDDTVVDNTVVGIIKFGENYSIEGAQDLRVKTTKINIS